MPPRAAVAGIVLFWLATAGYVAYRDVWPRVFASGPPPVAVELADEAKPNVPARWGVLRNGQKIGSLTTLMRYNDAADEFQFTYRYAHLKLEQNGVVLEVPEALSDVRMTRDGDLREHTMTGKLEVVAGAFRVGGEITVRGVVAGGVLSGRGEVKSPLGDFAADLDPVPVKKGQPLNPLQPVNRIAGVRGGMPDWVVSEYNPLQDAVANLMRKQLAARGLPLLGEPKPKTSLVARVAGDPQPLLWQKKELACWVIEYRRDAGTVARTWVQVADGKVLRQEASEGGEVLTFERED